MIYDLDFRTTVYATITIEAKDRREAFKRGCELLDSERFIDEVLMPRFERCGISAENMDYEPDVMQGDGEVDFTESMIREYLEA